MPIKVIVPNALRPYAAGLDYVTLEVETVGDALQELVQRYPPLQGRLPQQDGQGSAIYRNSMMVSKLQGLETPLRDGDTLTLIVPEGWL